MSPHALKPWLALPAPSPGILAAPFLFSPEVIESITTAEARGEFTAERFKERHPDKYRATEYLLAKNWSHAEIARTLQVHHRTVSRVADIAQVSIDAIRQGLVKKLRRGAEQLLDRILDNPGSIPPNSLGLTMSQLIDKAELLDGRATVRSEHTEAIDIYANFEATIRERLPAGELREIEATLVPGIGFEGEKKAAIKYAGDKAAADRESEEPATLLQASIHDVTAFTPALDPIPIQSAASPDARKEGAGGGSTHVEGSPTSNGSDERNFSDNRSTSS